MMLKKKAGIKADPAKVKSIAEWPALKTVTDVRAFLGLVRYVEMFLPHLASLMSMLTLLTVKDADKKFPRWDTTH